MSDKGRARLTQSDEVLLRQVYPTWLEEEGQPSSMAFYPWRQVDEGQLSVDRGTLTTPQNAYLQFTAAKPAGFGMDSAGVWGLTVAEVAEQGVIPWEDPVEATETTPSNPAHALLDFEGLESRIWKKIGRLLKMKARDRGRLFPPPAPA